MIPSYADIPIAKVITESPDLYDLFGTRVYPAGEAPQGTATPFVVFRIANGLPESYLTGGPTVDQFTVQVDVYADTVATAREGAGELIQALECRGYIRHAGEFREPETRKVRISFDADFFVDRC